MESECSDESFNILDIPVFVDKFGIDAWDEKVSSLQNIEGMEVDDLPYDVISVEKTWGKKSAEMDQTDDEDSSEVFKEIVEANQKVAMAEMNFHVSPEHILANLTNEDALIIPRRRRAKTDQISVVEQPDSINDNDRLKRIKTEQKKNERKVTYALVYDKEAKTKRVVLVDRGAELPSNFEMASIQGPLPPAPKEFSAEVLPTLQNLAARQTGSSLKNQILPPAAVRTAQLNTYLSTSQSQAKGLSSLSDLMMAERQKLTVRRGDSTKLVSRNNMNNASQDPIATTSQQTNELSPATRRFVEVDVPPVINAIKVSITPPQMTSNKSPASKPSQSVNPVPMYLLLGCKICGAAFPCHNDHDFKKHLFVQHGMDIQDKQYEDYITRTQNLSQCKKCKVVLTKKRDEHQRSCLPNLTKETAFEDVDQSGGNWVKKVHYVCGVNDCRLLFKMRKELAIHTLNDHKNFAGKMIMDPEFRCAQCLKRFTDSFALGQHCGRCVDIRPSTETLLELAKSLLYCEFCRKNHGTLSESTSCYLNNRIYRCVLCLAMFRDKSFFYKHLHQYHGLSKSEENALALSCHMCDISPNKYTVIFPHIVTEHLGPILARNPNLSTPKAPPTQVASTQNLVTTQQRPQGRPSEGTGNRSSSVAGGASTVTTDVGNSQASKKIPGLQPISTPAVTQTPPGILLNTTRLTPIITVPSGLPQVSSSVGKTSASQSQVFGQSPIILVPSARKLGQQPKTGNIANAQQGVAGNTSPAVRQTMSGLFKQGSQNVVRTAPVGLVRPILTFDHLAPRTIVTTSMQSQYSTSRPTILPRSPANTSTISIAPVSTNSGTSAYRPIILTSVQQTSVSYVSASTGAPGARLASVVRAPAGVYSGPTNVTPIGVRAPVIRPPPPQTMAASVLTISSSPEVRASTVPNTTNASSSTTHTAAPNTSQSAISNPATGNNTTNSNPTPAATPLTIPATAKPSAKPGSRVVTIGGRTYEYQVIQDKLARKSQQVTQSTSGYTVARHDVPANNYRVPLPIGKPPRPIAPNASSPQQPKPAANTNTSSPSSNVSSTVTNKK